MSKWMKIIWTLISYAPLYFVAGIALLIDSLTIKQIANQIFYGIGLIIFAILCVPICFFILYKVKKKVSPTKLFVELAESGDGNALSSMIAYLFPLVTLTIADINIWIFWALVIVIILMLLWSKAIFTNPLVYFGQYRYYKVQASSGVTYTLLSKQRRFDPKKVKNVIELFDEIYLEV